MTQVNSPIATCGAELANSNAISSDWRVDATPRFDAYCGKGQSRVFDTAGECSRPQAAAFMRVTKEDRRVCARGTSESQRSTRTRLMAAAVRRCWRWVR